MLNARETVFLLPAMKSTLRSKLTTVFVRARVNALAAEAASVDPAPDIVIERIGDLMSHNSSDFEKHP